MSYEKELDVVGIEINLVCATGEKIEVDIDKESQKVFWSLLNNFFKPEIPLKDFTPNQ